MIREGLNLLFKSRSSYKQFFTTFNKLNKNLSVIKTNKFKFSTQ
jgi:hypothetical protein